MSVRDLWVSKRSGQPTRRYGHGRRWLAVWTGADGKEHSKAWERRSHAAQYAAQMATDAAMQRSLARREPPATRALIARDRKFPATLRRNGGPVEVFVTRKGIQVTGRVYTEAEECLAEQQLDSVSMRGAQREITSWLLGQGYEPAGDWEWTAGTDGEDEGETVRAFQRQPEDAPGAGLVISHDPRRVP